MTLSSFATASIVQRIQMIEAALEKALDRSGMYIGSDADGELSIRCVEEPFSDCFVCHSLYSIAREIEVMLS